MYIYFREVFELYVKGFFFVGRRVVHVGELYGVLRGYREINITVNCILPITPVILHGFLVHNLHS
jgi:hypothetical protein